MNKRNPTFKQLTKPINIFKWQGLYKIMTITQLLGARPNFKYVVIWLQHFPIILPMQI